MSKRALSLLVLVAGAYALYRLVRYMRPGLRDEWGPIPVAPPSSIPVPPVVLPPP